MRDNFLCDAKVSQLELFVLYAGSYYILVNLVSLGFEH